MLQSTSEYEERNFDDIQRALDIEHTVKALESQLCYDQHSPEEVARQILKAACKFYDADWCGLIQVDLDLKIWTPFWWYNDSSEDKTTILTEEFESAEFLDRWVQAVRHGKPMIVPDAEEVKNTYPAEYNLYQRLGPSETLRRLAIRFPGGSAKAEVERRRRKVEDQSDADGEVVNVILEIANEIAREQ